MTAKKTLKKKPSKKPVNKGLAKAAVGALKTTTKSRVSQADVPSTSLEKATSVAQAIWDHGGRPTAPVDLALSLKISPGSSGWRTLCGASIGYGLTTGGHTAQSIGLTELGRRVVAPQKDGEKERALQEAALKPTIVAEFLERYSNQKWPRDDIGVNVLVSMEVPKDRALEVLKTIRENAVFCGFLREGPTGYFLRLHPGLNFMEPEKNPEQGEEEKVSKAAFDSHVNGQMGTAPESKLPPNRRVFISHGKHKEIRDQLKELLNFGKFEPIISVERETASKPVSEKVLDDMRACFAAAIHVSSEGECLNQQGEKFTRINENVLIEIGAAMALYTGNKFVLLVEKGVELPSNLQGLYRCDYEGNKLDYDATMKLLKIFSGF